ESLACKRCACRNACASADNCVCSQVPSILIGNVHRAAFSVTVACFLAEQFTKHLIYGCTFGKTMTMTAMGTGNVIFFIECFTDPDSNCLFTNIQMCQAGHLRALIQLVDLLLECANLEHLLVHLQPLLAIYIRQGLIF